MRSCILFLCLLSFTALAFTRSIVPQADGEGSIGTPTKAWGAGYFSNLVVNGENLNTKLSTNRVFSFNTLTGSVELVAGDGVQIVTNGNQLTVKLVESQTEAIGTNRVYFTYTGYTNYWTVPSNVTEIAVWAWGAAGGKEGGDTLPRSAGGFTYAIVPVTNYQMLSIVVGQGGGYLFSLAVTSTTGNAFGGGGAAPYIPQMTTRPACGGGGYSGVFNYSNNEPLVIAGGGGGGSFGSAIGVSAGGGLIGGSGQSFAGIPATGGTQTEGGKAGISTSTSNYIFSATDGSYLLGGDAGIQFGGTREYGAGGGGYYGGGGGVSGVLNNFGGGGGGSGYISTNSAGITFRAFALTPPGTELPEYIPNAGAARGNNSGNNGLIVIGHK
jgi:hypothetical protein